MKNQYSHSSPLVFGLGRCANDSKNAVITMKNWTFFTVVCLTSICPALLPYPFDFNMSNRRISSLSDDDVGLLPWTWKSPCICVETLYEFRCMSCTRTCGNQDISGWVPAKSHAIKWTASISAQCWFSHLNRMVILGTRIVHHKYHWASFHTLCWKINQVIRSK